MTKKLTILIIAFCIIILALPFQSFSQSANTLVRKGKRYVKKENYLRALPIFEKALETDPNNNKALFEAGVCYLHRYSKEKGLAYIDSAVTKSPRVDKHAHYWLGRAMQLNYKFDSAIEEFEAYKNKLGQKDSRRSDVLLHIKQCNNAKEMILQPADFFIENLGSGINSKYSDHSPVVSNDDNVLLFTSRKETSTGNVETFTGEFYEDIYVSEKKDDKWGSLSQIGDQLNSTGHDACSQLIGQDKLVMYRSLRNGDIYMSTKEGNIWQKPEEIEGVNTAGYESSAFVSPDGKRIYFATNNYSDGADLDIYYAELQSDGTYGDAKEVENINTEQEEDGIYITNDGKYLYFSSRGHPGMGGFDIFKSTWDGKAWSAPVNLGYPVNTPDDDIYYYMSKDGQKGYLSSYRDGSFGEKDIYMVVEVPKVMLSGNIIDKLSNKPVPNNELIIELKAINDKNGKYSAKLGTSNGNFSNLIQSNKTYQVSIIKGADTLGKETLVVPVFVGTGNTFMKDFVVTYFTDSISAGLKDTTRKVKEPVKELVKDTIIATKEIIFGNVFFEKNFSKINKKYFVALNEVVRLMKTHKEISLEVQGFADEDGDQEFNNKLSQLRANNVFDYLVTRGISRSRITFKGMGTTTKFGQGATEEEKMQNRRVEFIKK